MGHEIFFKFFDGPQNIFLCSIFAFNIRDFLENLINIIVNANFFSDLNITMSTTLK